MQPTRGCPTDRVTHDRLAEIHFSYGQQVSLRFSFAQECHLHFTGYIFSIELGSHEDSDLRCEE
jgi:hypothetical protein